ncbi:MAG: hypothetical protein IJ040_03535 [Lachnospiraceae bacterium]|nr:hypothetical protein [Lachnospiraceae bacterium]
MGFWKRVGSLFKRSKRESNKELESMDYGEQQSLAEESELSHHLTQIVDSTYEMEDLKREYELVTSYFSDIQKIEQMEPGYLRKLEDDARKILMLEENRKQYQHTPKRISPERYKLMMRLESEVPQGIQRLRELEDMRGKIKRDLEYLEGEKGAIKYEEEELQTRQATMRNVAIVVGLLALLSVLIFLFLNVQYEVDLTAAGAGIAIVAVIVEFFLFLGYNRANYDRKVCFQKHNRAIQLQNKVKIKWLNNTNNLDFLYAKYEVNSRKELEYDWEQYRLTVEEEEQYQKNTGDLRVYQEEIVMNLKRAGLRDVEIWLQQIVALVDKREMVEVKHSLNVRRQKLRDRMKVNEETRQNSLVCVKGILTEHPELKEQAKEVLTSYHIAV